MVRGPSPSRRDEEPPQPPSTTSLSIEEVIELLDTDPERSSEDHASFAEFVQEIQDTAVSQSNGTHFDVPDAVEDCHGQHRTTRWQSRSLVSRAVRGLLPCPARSGTPRVSGSGSRLGARLAPRITKGSPGTICRSGSPVINRERLSRFQRMFIWYSGAGEGWALYAERLMDELGYFEKPEYRLG